MVDCRNDDIWCMGDTHTEIEILAIARARAANNELAGYAYLAMYGETDQEKKTNLEQAAIHGDAESQLEMGSLYEHQGLYSEAIDMYEKASLQDYREGDLLVGFMIAKGLGCKKDPIKAIQRMMKVRLDGKDMSEIVISFADGPISWDSNTYNVETLKDIFGDLKEDQFNEVLGYLNSNGYKALEIRKEVLITRISELLKAKKSISSECYLSIIRILE